MTFPWSKKFEQQKIPPEYITSHLVWSWKLQPTKKVNNIMRSMYFTKRKKECIDLLPDVLVVIDLNARLVGEVTVSGPSLSHHRHHVLPIGMERAWHGLELVCLI
jgi:hypothetical protein